MHHPETDYEAVAREVAAEFKDLPNVQRAVAHAAAGDITWRQCHDLLQDALAAGLEAVR